MNKLRKIFVLILVAALIAVSMAFVAYAAEDEENEMKTLIDSSTVWRYLDDDTDPSEDFDSLQVWTEPDFDDSGWKSAAGSFGSSNGVLANITNCGIPTNLIELKKPDGSGSNISTYYFRTDFTVGRGETVKSIDFSLRADDAVIIYLNGTVIFDSRTSVPETAATTNKYYAQMTKAINSFTVDESVLDGVIMTGKNVISAELHNNQAGSSDIFFGMESAKATVSKKEIAIAGETLDLYDANAKWRYLDDDSDPVENMDSLQAWTEPVFDDSGWKSAAGSFGSKGGALENVTGCGIPKTLVNLYVPGQSTTVIPTYYFRTYFNIEDASKILALNFTMHGDDAIVVYLNGAMIHYSGSELSSDAATTNRYYASYDAAEQKFTVTYEVLDGLLLDGANVLAVELHNNQSTSSDIYFGLDSFSAIVEVDKIEPTFEQIVMGMGTDESERGLSWYSVSSAAASVEYAPVSENREEFPAEFKTVSAVTKASENKTGYYVSKATLKNLNESTEYVYRIVSDGVYSELKYFKTDDTEEFEFIFVGDPQLASAAHGAQWQDTLQKINANFDAQLIVSAGDQINTPSSETEYSYFITEELSRIAFTPTVGPPHDDPSIAFSEHFYTPNLSDKYGVTVSSANYWYRYGSALFMHLNMADGTALESEHKQFIEETMAKNTDAVWNIVVLHKALFATGAHGDPNGRYFETEMSIIRPTLAAQLTELGIDIAMGGHDHVYVRSHLMNGVEVSDDEVYDNKAINPTGTLHISAGSSTGSKYHTSYSDDVYFAAYQNDELRKSVIHFTVTDDALVMKSYFLDTMSEFDSFTIEKKLKPDGSVPSKATVKWLDANGKLIATNVGYEGFVADIPTDAFVPSGDGYRNVRITKWLDENGNESDLIIGEKSEYTFKAAMKQPSSGGYIAGISGAMLNLTYYSQFHMNLYLPIRENMERPTVLGANAAYAKAFISNKEYWVYTWYLSTASASDDLNVTVNFTLDGVNYSDTLTIGALTYSEIAISKATATEKIAIANMLRYVREARILAKMEVSERFDALIGSVDGTVSGLVSLPAYPTEYMATDTNLGDLSNYLTTFYLRITGSPNFVLELNAAAVKAGITHESFTIYTESGTRVYLFSYAGDGKTFQTNNLRVYDATEKLTITLTVPASEAGGAATTVVGTYSLGTYLAAMDKAGENVDVAKALYAFGIAAGEYRKTLK